MRYNEKVYWDVLKRSQDIKFQQQKGEQINYIGSMRKQKLSSSKQIPIQLSANKKSHSINLKTKQQPLFAPYKIDWKSPTNDNVFYGMAPSIPLKQPFRNIENSNPHTTNTNSKAFYQNMKNELMNIKQDVEKLIMKEKKPSTTDHSARNDSFDSNQMHNGCIKTLNIKNKCQQKISKIESLYQNVDKVLANKICDYMPPSKFTVGESRLDHPLMYNFINDQVRNNSNLDTNYQSQKQTYVRTKSKSIADAFNKATDLHTINLTHNSKYNYLNAQIGRSSQKQITSELTSKAELNQEEQDEYSVKPKIQVDINLPSFDRIKTKDKNDEQKNQLIQKLKAELQQLQNQLQLRNELMSRKENSKFQLTEEVQKLKKLLESQKLKQSQLQQRNQQLQQQLSSNNQNKHQEAINQIGLKHESEVDQLRRIHFEQQNKLNYLEEELQKSIHAIRQKQQENIHLIQSLNSQNNTIQQLSEACEQLGMQITSMKDSVQESRKTKEKLKLKENQLYIYQEELKEAKSKIKLLKHDIQSNNNNSLYNKPQNNPYIHNHKNVIDHTQTQTLSSQLKETQKINHLFKSENDRLKIQLHSLKQINSDNQIKIKELLKENSQLNKKICSMEKDSQKALQQLMNNEGFQSIGEQISRKLSTMVDENYNLKNKISHLQSSLEQITLKNRSLTEELMIYEEKVILQNDCTRRLKIQDWDNLTEERDSLKIQLENVQSRLEETKEFYQVQTMKKQNQIHELKGQINDMIEIESQRDQKIHPNLRSVKHIKNLNVLLNEFKDMIEYNLEMKQQISKLKSVSA